MKINRYDWEYAFFWKEKIRSVYLYDLLDKGSNSYDCVLNCKLVINVDCNRSADLVKNISYGTNVIGSKFSINGLKKLKNKKEKEKENKYKLSLYKDIQNSKSILYFYFFYLTKVFKDKKIHLSLKKGKLFYNTSLSSLNNSLKVGYPLGLNEIDPRLILNIRSKTINLNFLINLILYNI